MTNRPKSVNQLQEYLNANQVSISSFNTCLFDINSLPANIILHL